MDAVWLNHKSTGLLGRSVLYIQAELPKSIVFNMWGELIFATDWHGACLSSRDALPIQSVVPVRRNLRIGPLGRYLHNRLGHRGIKTDVSTMVRYVNGRLRKMREITEKSTQRWITCWVHCHPPVQVCNYWILLPPMSNEQDPMIISAGNWSILFFISWWQITLNTSRCEMRDELCLCLTGQPMYHDSFIWCSLITK